MTHKLVLIRHGESQWNLENRFTGWTDVDLTDNGRQEAIRAGQLLKQEGYDFDLCYTSVLRRAIGTLWTVLGEMDRMWLPVTHSWRLNERHYGNLQGWNKAETAEKYGEDQVKIWRRAYAIAPPPLAEDDPRLVEQLNNPRYANVPRAELPRTECLKDTVARVLPFWNETIAPSIKSGKRVIIAAHGNSLRALVKHLDGICHVYIDDSADVDMAVRVADNAKTQRYAPCNTLETLLVHEAIAPEVLPRLGSIYRMKQVELRADEHGARLLQEAQIGTRHRGRLAHRIPGADPCHPRGEEPGRGHCAHQRVRLAPHRFDHHPEPCTRDALPAGSGFRLSDDQCLHPLR